VAVQQRRALRARSRGVVGTRQTRAAARGARVLSAGEVARLAIGAGFSSRDGSARGASLEDGGAYSAAAVAVAIAKAESGFNANAVNGASGATGLWQIYPGGDRFLDPQVNARVAHRKYVTQGWDAWSAFTSGAHRGNLTLADDAVRAAGGRAPRDPGTAIPLGPDFGLITGPGGGIIGETLGGILGGVFGAILPILKIAAGGVGLVVSGTALVYLAGRNVGANAAVGQALGMVPTPVAQGAGVVLRGGARRVEERKAIRSEVTARRRQIAREVGRSRVVTEDRGRGERIRVSSRREAREAQATYDEGAPRVKAERQRARLKALRSRRPARARSAPSWS